MTQIQSAREKVSFAAPALPDFGTLVEKPAVVAAILSACVLFSAAMALRNYEDPIGADQGLNAVIGHELLNGRVLYGDLWDQKPPGVYLMYAVAEFFAGYGPQQLYLLNLAGWAITLLGLYQAAKLLAGVRAGLCAGLLWSILVILPEWFTQPNGEVFITAALTWSYCFLLRLSVAPKWRRACAFGAAVGIASLFKPTAVAPAGLMGLAYIAWSWRRGAGTGLALRHMVLAAAVSSLPWIACSACFWALGCFGDFTDTVFVYNRYYSGDMVANLMSCLDPHRKRYLLLVILPCLLLPFLPGARVSREQQCGWLGLAAWAAGCAIAIALTGHWYHHYFQLWMPIYALAGGSFLALPLAGRWLKRSAWRGALLATVFVPLAAAHWNRPGPMPEWMLQRYGGINRVVCRQLGLAIGRELHPDEAIYVLGGLGETSGVYVASHRSPPSGLIFDFPLRGGPLAGRLEERILLDLGRNPPDLIVLSKNSFIPGLDGKPAAWGQRVVDWVLRHYERRGFDGPAKYAYYAHQGSDLARRLPEAHARSAHAAK